jgi:hypothetical protein
MSASLFIIGCTQDPEIRYVPSPSLIPIDKMVNDATAIQAALDDSRYTTVGYVVDSTDTLDGALVVPENKALVIYSRLEVYIDGIEVKDTVYVEADGDLVAASTKKISVTGDGRVYVAKSGTLSIDAATDVDNGATVAATVLGAKAIINGGTLKINAAGATMAFTDAATLLDKVNRGTVDASALTSTSGGKPSEIADAVKTKSRLGTSKTFVATSRADESESTLTIPAGLELTAETGEMESKPTTLIVRGVLKRAAVAKLSTVDTLILTGELTGSVLTLAGINDKSDITGNGYLRSSGTTVTTGAAEALLDSGLAGVELGTTALAAIAIPNNVYRSLTGTAVAPTGNVSVGSGSTLYVGAKLTIAKSATLNVTGTVNVASTGSLVLTGSTDTDGAKLTGTGKVVLGLTEISGGTSDWQAVGTDTQIVTFLSAAGGATVTAHSTGMVLTAQGANAKITQKAGAGNTLTIAAATAIDIGEGGTITLAKHATDGGKLNLNATTAKITGLTGGQTDRNLTTGNIAYATYT